MWTAECQKSKMIRREHDHQQILSWRKEKPGTCSNHAFRPTDFKLHINLDWTPQKLAENSLGLHRSSREKTLSSYEHRRKNGVKGGKMWGKTEKKKIFFCLFVCLNQQHWPPAPDRRHHIAYFCVHSFAVFAYLQRQINKKRWVTGSFGNKYPPVFRQIQSTCRLVIYAPNHNS